MNDSHEKARTQFTHEVGSVKLTLSDKDVARFWRKVNRSGPIPTTCPELGPCWIWIAGLNDRGYGQFSIGYTTAHSHRVAHSIALGPYDYALFLCHRCDTPACVNPSHMFLGTAMENSTDMVSKDRQAKRGGELCAHSKLTNEQVIELRARYAAGGIALAPLGREYGINLGSTWAIIKRKTWKRI